MELSLARFTASKTATGAVEAILTFPFEHLKSGCVSPYMGGVRKEQAHEPRVHHLGGSVSPQRAGGQRPHGAGTRSGQRRAQPAAGARARAERHSLSPLRAR